MATVYIRIIAGTKGRGFASTLGNQPNQRLQIGLLYGIMVFHFNLIHLYPSVENPKYPPADVEVTGWQAFSHRDTRD